MYFVTGEVIKKSCGIGLFYLQENPNHHGIFSLGGVVTL